MNVNVFLQLVSILCRILTIAYVASLFKDMKYGFRLIIVRLFVFYDFAPIEWLSQNILYLYYLIFVLAQFGFVVGLIHEFSLNQVNSKSWEFFYSSPLTTMSTCLIIFELIKRIKKP